MTRSRVAMVSSRRSLPCWGTLFMLLLTPHVWTFALVHNGNLTRSRTPRPLLLRLLCLNLQELPFLLFLSLHLEVLGLPHLEHSHLVVKGLEDALIGLLGRVLTLFVEPVLRLVKVILDLLVRLLLLQLVCFSHNGGPVLVQLLLQHVLRLLPGNLLRVLLLHPLLSLLQLCHDLLRKSTERSFSEAKFDHCPLG